MPATRRFGTRPTLDPSRTPDAGEGKGRNPGHEPSAGSPTRSKSIMPSHFRSPSASELRPARAGPINRETGTIRDAGAALSLFPATDDVRTFARPGGDHPSDRGDLDRREKGQSRGEDREGRGRLCKEKRGAETNARDPPTPDHSGGRTGYAGGDARRRPRPRRARDARLRPDPSDPPRTRRLYLLPRDRRGRAERQPARPSRRRPRRRRRLPAELAPALATDGAFSINGFARFRGQAQARRRAEQLRYLCACYADLDGYRAGLSDGQIIGRILDAADAGDIPEPSVTARSGPGRLGFSGYWKTSGGRGIPTWRTRGRGRGTAAFSGR